MTEKASAHKQKPLNMFAEFTMVNSPMFGTYFGFTDDEVDDLYERYCRECEKQRKIKNAKDSKQSIRCRNKFNPKTGKIQHSCPKVSI